MNEQSIIIDRFVDRFVSYFNLDLICECTGVDRDVVQERLNQLLTGNVIRKVSKYEDIYVTNRGRYNINVATIYCGNWAFDLKACQDICFLPPGTGIRELMLWHGSGVPRPGRIVDEQGNPVEHVEDGVVVLVEAERENGFDAAVARRFGHFIDRSARAGSARERGLHAQAPQRHAEIERRLRRAGPFCVAEEVKDIHAAVSAHGRASRASDLLSSVSRLAAV